MKHMIKTIAMLSLSACILVGGAVSSFAADPTDRYAADILYHQADDCEGTAKAEIVVRFASPYGDTKTYTICAECGDVNGQSTLSAVDNAVTNFGGLEVYQGKLDNGVQVMTVSCMTSGYSALDGVTANVMMPKSSIEGYDLYLIHDDGTESKLEVSDSDNWSYINVYMENGAALIRMVPQS